MHVFGKIFKGLSGISLNFFFKKVGTLDTLLAKMVYTGGDYFMKLVLF